MPSVGYFVIIKDLQGWRFARASKWDGVSFYMEDGLQLSHQVYLATKTNLLALTTGAEPDKVNKQMYWPMTAEQAIEFLEEHGYGTDDNLRIWPMLGDPFMEIKPGHIGPMIAVHIKSCRERSKNPEAEPVVIVHHEFQDEQGQTQGGLCQVFDMNKLVPLPCDQEPAGKFMMFGQQICLNFRDYYLIPKGSNTLAMHKFLTVAEGPESLEALAKENRFIDRDAVVRKSGKAKLAVKELSIDDFLR